MYNDTRRPQWLFTVTHQSLSPFQIKIKYKKLSVRVQMPFYTFYQFVNILLTRELKKIIFWIINKTKLKQLTYLPKKLINQTTRSFLMGTNLRYKSQVCNSRSSDSVLKRTMMSSAGSGKNLPKLPSNNDPSTSTRIIPGSNTDGRSITEENDDYIDSKALIILINKDIEVFYIILMTMDNLIPWMTFKAYLTKIVPIIINKKENPCKNIAMSWLWHNELVEREKGLFLSDEKLEIFILFFNPFSE